MSKYCFVLHGAKEGTADAESVLKKKLGARFKLSDAAVNSLFNNLPVVIKKGLDESQIAAYRKVFEQIGAIVEIVEEDTKATGALAFDEPEADASTPSPKAPSPVPSAPVPPGPQLNPPSVFSFGFDEPPQEQGEEKHQEKAPTLPSPPKRSAPSIPDTAKAELEIPPSMPTPPTSLKHEEPITNSPQEIPPASLVSIVRPSLTIFIRDNKPVCLGAVAIAVLLLVYVFLPAPTVPPPEQLKPEQMVDKLLRDQDGILPAKRRAKKKEILAPAGLPTTLEANGADESTKSELVFEIQDNKFTRIDISIASLPPPKLTPELVVSGIVRKPWLERFSLSIEGKDISSQEATADGWSFSGQAIGKAYLADDSGRDRHIAIFQISGSYDSKTKQLTGTWRLNDGQTLNDATSSFSERLAPGRVRFLLIGSFVATAKGENDAQ